MVDKVVDKVVLSYFLGLSYVLTVLPGQYLGPLTYLVIRYYFVTD